MGKKDKSNGKTLPQAVPPQSTIDPSSKKTGIDKEKKDKKEKKEFVEKDKQEVVNSFSNELTQKQKEHELEVGKTIGKIRIIAKDSERLQRRQIHDFGMTLDMMEDLKVSLNELKQQNDDLLQQMSEAKTVYDKLEAEHTSTKLKFDETVRTLKQLKKESRTWPKAEVLLQKTEERFNRLTESNKKFRLILLKRRINPNMELRDLERQHHEQAVMQSIPKHKRNYENEMLTKGRYKVVRDMSDLYRMTREDLMHDYGISHNTLDQVSPAYLGFYWKRQVAKKMRKETESPRPGLTLPRIIAKPRLIYY